MEEEEGALRGMKRAAPRAEVVAEALRVSEMGVEGVSAALREVVEVPMTPAAEALELPEEGVHVTREWRVSARLGVVVASSRWAGEDPYSMLWSEGAGGR